MGFLHNGVVPPARRDLSTYSQRSKNPKFTGGLLALKTQHFGRDPRPGNKLIFSVRWVAVDGLSTNVKLFGLADQLLCLPVAQALGFLVFCSYATRFTAVPDEAVMLR